MRSKKLLIGSAAPLLILTAVGLSLSSFYRSALEQFFDRRLDIYLRMLTTDVAMLSQNDKFPQVTGEPLFELPLSGWYWQVTRLDAKKPEVHSSRSLWDSSLPRLPDDGSGYVTGPEDQKLRLVERTIDLDDGGRFLISVAGDSSELTDLFTSFNRALLIGFGFLSFVLVGITLIPAARYRSDQRPQSTDREGASAGNPAA